MKTIVGPSLSRGALQCCSGAAVTTRDLERATHALRCRLKTPRTASRRSRDEEDDRPSESVREDERRRRWIRKNRFAAETVRKLQQSLSNRVAPYEATELSKQQAIRELSPQIVTLRSKGYSWMAVAAMLSEHGVPVSVAALRTYLRRAREEAVSAPPPSPAKRPRDAHALARPTPSPAPTEPSSSQTREASGSGRSVRRPSPHSRRPSRHL